MPTKNTVILCFLPFIFLVLAVHLHWSLKIAMIKKSQNCIIKGLFDGRIRIRTVQISVARPGCQKLTISDPGTLPKPMPICKFTSFFGFRKQALRLQAVRQKLRQPRLPLGPQQAARGGQQAIRLLILSQGRVGKKPGFFF
jgi:hypothetical protein